MVDYAKALLNTIKQAIEEATGKVYEAENAVANISRDYAENKLRQIMEGDNNKIREELEALKLETNTLGVDIRECLAGNEEELSNLPDVYSKKANDAIQENVNKCYSLVSRAKNEIGQSAAEVVKSVRELDTCIRESPSGIKLSALVWRIFIESTSIPYKMSKQTYSISKALVQLPNSISKIIVETSREEVDHAREIFQKISRCAENKKREERKDSKCEKGMFSTYF